jgi:SAM-dependent methyltransferase
MELLTRGIKSLWQKGPTRTLQSIMSIAEDALFDRRHHLETAKIVKVGDLDIDDEAKQHSIQYQPTRVRHFRKLMRALQLPTNQVFVDVGCGKGRMLIAAALYGFERVVGVEISPQLCETARRNLETFRRHADAKTEFEVVCANVVEFDLCDDEGVFYLYWPFDRSVMVEFVEKVRASIEREPRDVWLIVNDFRYQDVFDADEQFAYRGRIVYGGGEFDVYHHAPAAVATAR